MADRDYYKELIEEQNVIRDTWNKAKEKLKDLIESKYFDFAESHEYYVSEDIVNIIEVKDRNQGYKSYPHCREVDTKDSRLYMRHTDNLETFNGESKYEGEEVIYWVWQTVGFLGDDYSGFLLLPMLDGRYWKISYNC